MSIQEYISRVPNTHPNAKIPFIISMIDSNGILKDMPFPPQEGLLSTDRIMGVELMINPRSISNNQAKIINRSQTMTSFVEEHWGDEIDTITFQGQSAAFVVGGDDLYSIKNGPGNSPTMEFLRTGGLTDPKVLARSLLFSFSGSTQDPMSGMGINDNEIGLTVTNRRQSVSYRQFKRMVDLIRANGCFFDTFGMLSKRYYIMLSYGSTAYKGYFESLDITEDANNPYTFAFTSTFKIEETLFSYVDRNLSYNNINWEP